MTYVPRMRQLAELRSTRALERAMKDRDLNGQELAVLAKTNRQTISNLRRGRATKTSVTTARAIATVLRVPASDLFDLDAEDDRAGVAS